MNEENMFASFGTTSLSIAVYSIMCYILGIELIENVDERCHVIFGAVDAVHAVVDGDEANIGIGKDHLSVHADLKVVSAQP